VQRAEAVGAQDRRELCVFILGDNGMKPFDREWQCSDGGTSSVRYGLHSCDAGMAVQ